MIADAHLHMFPPMGGPSGHRSAREHLRYVQRELVFHHLPLRRASDGAIVQKQTLFNGTDYSFDGLLDVNFRSGGHGRLMWTHQGVDYYKQYLPPYMTDLAAPPEMMVTQMNHAGVDRGVWGWADAATPAR